MAEPVKKDDALAAAVREAFHRHMENARLASLAAGQAIPRTDPKRPTLAAANVRQIELRAEQNSPSPAPKPPAEIRLPSIDKAPLPELPKFSVERHSEPSKPTDAGPAGDSKFIDVLPRAPKESPPRPPRAATPSLPVVAETGRNLASLAPPAPANDGAREPPRGRQLAVAPPQDRQRRREAPSALAEGTGEAAQPARAKISPPVSRPRTTQRREAANANQGVHFGTGSRREVQERSSSRWIIMAALGAASLLCIGIGGYVWISASAPNPKGAVEGRVSTPAPAGAASQVASAPAAVEQTGKTDAALPGSSSSTAAAAPQAESPINARSVQTTAIKLDTIDLAVQDARERRDMGDVAAARLILERYRDGGDPRALFALAETYDPSVVRNPALADAKQAQELYEAAGRAGSAASAERLARLQVEKPN